MNKTSKSYCTGDIQLQIQKTGIVGQHQNVKLKKKKKKTIQGKKGKIF